MSSNEKEILDRIDEMLNQLFDFVQKENKNQREFYLALVKAGADAVLAGKRADTEK